MLKGYYGALYFRTDFLSDFRRKDEDKNEDEKGNFFFESSYKVDSYIIGKLNLYWFMKYRLKEK